MVAGSEESSIHCRWLANLGKLAFLLLKLGTFLYYITQHTVHRFTHFDKNGRLTAMYLSTAYYIWTILSTRLWSDCLTQIISNEHNIHTYS